MPINNRQSDAAIHYQIIKNALYYSPGEKLFLFFARIYFFAINIKL